MSTFAVEPGKSSALAAAPARPQGFQRSAITVGATTDPAEHEADRVAGELMRLPAAGTLRRCSCGGDAGADGECAACKARSLERRATGPGPSAAPPIVHEVLSTSGRALDAASRSYFEPRLGIDLGGVRVHDDALAAESAKAVDAHAYTVGNHIAFAGRSPSGPSALLAHELVHVAQQHGALLHRQSSDSSSPDSGSSQQSSSSDSSGSGGGGGGGAGGATPGGSCKIDVRATHIGGALSVAPIWHTFVVYTDGAGAEWFFRGGPGKRSCSATSAPYFGIKGDSGRYVAGTVDWSPGAPSTTVLSGATACGKDTCFSSELSRIDAGCTAYAPTGPNSNTVARTLLSKCNVPQAKPVSIAPGWGDPDL